MHLAKCFLCLFSQEEEDSSTGDTYFGTQLATKQSYQMAMVAWVTRLARGVDVACASVLRIYFRFNNHSEAFWLHPTASDEHRIKRSVTVPP